MGELTDLCELYRAYCVEEGCRVNSAVLRYIEDRGAHYPLERLELSSNYLGARGLRPIIRLVEYSQTLTYLSMEGNGADNETVERLCGVLEKHLGLEYLSLRGNPITVTGGKRVLALVERNPRIIGVDLTDTDVFDALIYKITKATEANQQRAMKETPQLRFTEADVTQMPRGHIEHAAKRSSNEKLSLITLPAIAWESAGKEVAAKDKGQLTRLPNGGLAPTKLQPRQPIPALASKEFGRLPELQRQELQRRYKEKAMLLREINSSQASMAADRAREELMLLEKTTRSPVCRRTWESRTTTAKTGASLTSMTTTTTTAVTKNQQSFQPSQSQLPDLPETLSPITNTDAGLLPLHQQLQQGEEDHEALTRQEQPEADVTNYNTVDEAVMQRRSCDNYEVGSAADVHADADARVVVPAEPMGDAAAAVRPTKAEFSEKKELDKIPLDMLRETPQWMMLDSSEQFQHLFDSGCRAYVRHDFDDAYTAWNEAMGIAVNKKNREWMAVLSSNLKRLSYEMLVREGAEQLEQDNLDEAYVIFQRAEEVAREARNAKWEADMCKARKDVQHAVFQRCHEAALKVFERAQKLVKQKVTEDDYFVVPGTDVIMQHTEQYVNEWPRMLLVKEAVEVWVASRRVIERIGGADGHVLQDVVDEALHTVACFLAARCFDTEDTQSLSWMRTSSYSYHECIMLSVLWTDMASCDNFAERHKHFAAVAAAQIGNFYLATNQLAHAQTQFDKLEALAGELNDPLLCAAGHTFSAILNWQRSRYTAAEALLRSAVLEWGALRDSSSSLCTDENGGEDNAKENAETSCASLLLASVPADYVSIMESVSFKYLVSSIASTYRYSEALEVLERSLVCKYRDLLFDKMRVNFGAQPTLEHIVATSSQIRSPFIYQVTTHRYEWLTEERRYAVNEKLLMWVVPQRNGMRFVEVDVTKDFKVGSINELIETLRQGLLLDPLSSSSVTQGEILCTLPKRAWMEPLQTLYAIFVDPIVEFLRALDPLFLSKNGVITLIPTEQLWLVPFNALIARNGNFLVEDFALQMVFCATQCAFSALSAKRVLQRDLRRNVVLVQRETDTLPVNPMSHVAFPFDVLRSQKEGELILRTLAENKRSVRRSSRTTDSVCVTTSFETLVEDLDTFRELLPKSRMIFITTSTTSATRNDDNSSGAICMAMSQDDVDLLRSSEVARMRLFAELVVMSNTNMSTTRVVGTHDDVQGLVRGFLSSGVPCVIVGQWCTPDMIPSELLSKFLQLLSEANEMLPRSTANHDTAATIGTTAEVTTAASSVGVRMSVGPGDEDDEFGGHDAVSLHQHKTLLLAWAIRALLEDNFFRYSPRTWAGYCCIGYGSHQ
ncbi:TPR repeat-containing protein [Trypanosoma rangeli]|uniref:TPR repeat-containing protein n=1 Tax=Trypanosoma rangeli TaxID=5698 RepID=A0A3R7NEH3_TRYRA|nr:TPR repeat-containing protein [Trypanosoma rangeli]RNF05303.1 TPR repeat-containing protein [Trypanosoma rangeli]|eukprot:RNF05303.1 TPR repeat-containing protein [Trypanosoma rangeli]